MQFETYNSPSRLTGCWPQAIHMSEKRCTVCESPSWSYQTSLPDYVPTVNPPYCIFMRKSTYSRAAAGRRWVAPGSRLNREKRPRSCLVLSVNPGAPLKAPCMYKYTLYCR
eukprot:1195689-Prorocentrum_minimum.AAC.2